MKEFPTDAKAAIRQFTSADKGDVRRIACETSFLEYDRRLFLEDDEILADILTLYFTDYEPGSSFVAEGDGRVIGYLIGARDIGVMNGIFLTKVLPSIFFKALRRGTPARPNARCLLGRMLVSFLKGEFSLLDFSKDYPATFHINIDRDFRGQGLGRAMAARYCDFLADKGVRGVHVYTMSEKAVGFFCAVGFTPLFEIRRTHLQHRLKEPVRFHVLGRRLCPRGV